jgi:outer membrane protein OmpA-like peptidoglycan-associated protein
VVPQPDGDSATVTLRWSPVPIGIEVRDEQGRSIAAALTVTPTNGDAPSPLAAAADGRAKVDLRPGTYRLDIAAPTYGRQERDITITPGAKPRSIEVLLLPDEGDGTVEARISDGDGQPLETSRLLVDGRPVGTAGSGGRILVGDIKDGSHRLEVSAEGFQTLEQRDIATTAGGKQSRDIVLQRVPGSVRVVARTAEGRVVDAVVRIEGRPDGTDNPVRLAPTPLGDVGERIFVLRPGTWRVLVASAKYGVQTRDLVIRPEDFNLVTVDVVLQPAEEGQAELVVRVIDPEGTPVDDAQVALDGKVVGHTSTGGTVDLLGLTPGARKLTVSADLHRDHAPVDLFLVEGVQLHLDTLEWKPGTVRVTARTPEKAVSDGTARFSGPGTVAPLALGPRGQQYLTLPDGAWNVVVASPVAGLKQRKVDVPPDSRSLIDVDVVLTPSEGGTAGLDVRVVDPRKQPVAGARVSLDKDPLGTTGNSGSLTLSELDPGSRTLDVVAKAFDEKKQTVALKAGAQSVEIPLDWAVGAVQVVVRTGGKPLTDAVIRFVGPTPLSPQPVDREGQRVVQLTPGRWQAVVLSPSAGLGQQEVVIAKDQRGLQTVAFDLDGVAANEAEMLLQIRDPDGKPVPSAEVRLDKIAKGITRTGGSLLLGGLAPGKGELYVVAPQFQPVTVPTFEIPPGVSERIMTLQWIPVPLDVVVTDAQKHPLDAEVRFDGPAEVDPRHTGPDGTEQFQLRPGTWQVLASTKELGVQRKSVVVVPGGKLDPVTLVLNPAKVETVGGQVTIKDQVNFDFNSAVIGPQSTSILDEVAATILAHQEIARLEVQGHTDNVGDLAYNLQLSQQRAEAVVDALVKRGVPAERLTAAGYGATRPIFANDTDSGRAANRRVQFEIIGD